MSPDYQTIGVAIGSAIVGAGFGGKIAVALLKREVARVDAAVERVNECEQKLQRIELTIAGDLMTREDAAKLEAQLVKLGETLGVVKDMVLRQDEREKIRHGQG